MGRGLGGRDKRRFFQGSCEIQRGQTRADRATPRFLLSRRFLLAAVIVPNGMSDAIHNRSAAHTGGAKRHDVASENPRLQEHPREGEASG